MAMRAVGVGAERTIRVTAFGDPEEYYLEILRPSDSVYEPPCGGHIPGLEPEPRIILHEESVPYYEKGLALPSRRKITLSEVAIMINEVSIYRRNHLEYDIEKMRERVDCLERVAGSMREDADKAEKQA